MAFTTNRTELIIVVVALAVSVSQGTNYTLSCSGRGGSGSWNAAVRAFEYSGGKLKEVVP